MEDGSRVNAIYKNVALNDSYHRRFPENYHGRALKWELLVRKRYFGKLVKQDIIFSFPARNRFRKNTFKCLVELHS